MKWKKAASPRPVPSQKTSRFFTGFQAPALAAQGIPDIPPKVSPSGSPGLFSGRGPQPKKGAQTRRSAPAKLAPISGSAAAAVVAATAVVAAAVIVAAAAPVPTAAAAEQDDDEDDDPQAAPAAPIVIAAPHLSTS